MPAGSAAASALEAVAPGSTPGRATPCRRCHGTGLAPNLADADGLDCEECGGKGVAPERNRKIKRTAKCQACGRRFDEHGPRPDAQAWQCSGFVPPPYRQRAKKASDPRVVRVDAATAMTAAIALADQLLTGQSTSFAAAAFAAAPPSLQAGGSSFSPLGAAGIASIVEAPAAPPPVTGQPDAPGGAVSGPIPSPVEVARREVGPGPTISDPEAALLHHVATGVLPDPEHPPTANEAKEAWRTFMGEVRPRHDEWGEGA